MRHLCGETNFLQLHGQFIRVPSAVYRGVNFKKRRETQRKTKTKNPAAFPASWWSELKQLVDRLQTHRGNHCSKKNKKQTNMKFYHMTAGKKCLMMTCINVITGTNNDVSHLSLMDNIQICQISTRGDLFLMLFLQPSLRPTEAHTFFF